MTVGRTPIESEGLNANAALPESARAALERCTAQIERHEARVRAWCCLDLAGALGQVLALEAAHGAASGADSGAASGMPGPLLGSTVGLKDIIDTADMPTENGTVLHAGRRPSTDAELVTRLRQAGAVILGKTVTTELATYAPGVTTNPWNAAHTPGGSSSGSAAAVACGMADLAIGSQTNGSTIRPASFCGVVGFKPGRDRISRRGVLVQSPTFDTVGLFARDVAGVERLYRALAPLTGHTHGPSGDTDPQAPSTPPAPVRLLFWLTPYEGRLEASAAAALVGAAHRLGARFMQNETTDPRPWFDLETIVREHALIMEAEIARSFTAEYERGRDALSASLQGQIQRGRQTDDRTLATAQARLQHLRDRFDADWPEGVDFLMMPAAAGEAPPGLASTGDPIFCTMATALDLPAICIPGLRGSQGLPVGIQLVARRGCELSLLEAAQTLVLS